MINLKFEKIESDKINAHLNVNGKNTDFNYIDMIKALIIDKVMAEPEIVGPFSEEETKSIKSMVSFMNKALLPKSKTGS